MISNHEESYQSILCKLLSSRFPVLPPPIRPAATNLAPIPHDLSLTPRIAALELHPALEVLLHILNADLASAHFYVRHMQAPPAYEGMLLHALLHRYEGDIENARVWYGDIAGSTVMEWVWADASGVDVESQYENCGRRLREKAERAIERDEREGNRRKGDTEGKEVADENDASEPGSKAAKASSASFQRSSQYLNDLARLRQAKTKPRTYSDDKEQNGELAFNAKLEELERQSEVEVRHLLAWLEAKFGTQRWEDASSAWVRPTKKIQEIAKDQMMGGEGWREF